MSPVKPVSNRWEKLSSNTIPSRPRVRRIRPSIHAALCLRFPIAVQMRIATRTQNEVGLDPGRCRPADPRFNCFVGEETSLNTILPKAERAKFTAVFSLVNQKLLCVTKTEQGMFFLRQCLGRRCYPACDQAISLLSSFRTLHSLVLHLSGLAMMQWPAPIF